MKKEADDEHRFVVSYANKHTKNVAFFVCSEDERLIDDEEEEEEEEQEEEH